MPAPWERYQRRGPWERYQGSAPEAEPFVGPTQEQARRPITRTEAVMRSLASGLTFGAAPGMAAAARMAEDRDAPLSQQTMDPTIYERQKRHDRERLSAGRATYPISSATAEIGGAIASGVALPAARTVLGNIGQGAAVGGAYGYNETEDFGEAAKGAAIGGAVSGLGAAIASRLARGRPAKAPTIDQLKVAKDIAYQAADASTDIVPQSGLAQVVPRVERILTDEGFVPGLNPATKEALEVLYQESTRPGVVGHSLKGIETVRRQLLNAQTSAPNRADARLAGMILDEFDDFMEATVPAASSRYKEARGLYTRLRKAQDIEALFERAENAAGGYTQSGFENALRIQFRQLADNPKRFNRFSSEEREAILKVVRGGPIQAFVRFMGKFAARGPVSAMATGLLGNLAGGPAGAIALGTVGEGSRALAGGMRTSAANRVSELVRAGGPAARTAGSRPLPQFGYLPATAAAARLNYLVDDEPPNALTRR